MAFRINLASLLNPEATAPVQSVAKAPADQNGEGSGGGGCTGPASSSVRQHTVTMLLNTGPSDQAPSEAGRSESPGGGGGGGGDGGSSSPGPSPIMSISSVVTPLELQAEEMEGVEENKSKKKDKNKDDKTEEREQERQDKDQDDEMEEQQDDHDDDEEEQFDDEGIPAGPPSYPYTEEHGYFVWYHRVDLREDWRHVGTKFKARFGPGRTVMSLQNLYYTFSRKKGVECRRIGAGLHVPGVVGRTDKRYSWMRPEHRRRPRRR